MKISPFILLLGGYLHAQTPTVSDWENKAQRHLHLEQTQQAAQAFGKAAEICEQQALPDQFYFRYEQAKALLIQPNPKQPNEPEQLLRANASQAAGFKTSPNEAQLYADLGIFSLHRKQNSQDSSDFYLQKLENLYLNWEPKPQEALNYSFLGYQLALYYAEKQLAETVYKYILRAYSVLQKSEQKYSLRGLAIQSGFVKAGFYSDKINGELLKINQKLIDSCKSQSPYANHILADLEKNKQIIAYIKKDSNQLKTLADEYLRLLQATYPPTSVEIANHYSSWGMVQINVLKNVPQGAALLMKGIAMLEKIDTRNGRTNLAIACRNIANGYNQPESPFYNPTQARFFYQKGLNATLSAEYKLKTGLDFPDFADAKVYCINPIIALETMEALFRSYWQEPNHSPELLDKLLIINKARAALCQRVKEEARSEADLSYWGDIYYQLNQDYCKIYLETNQLEQLLRYSEENKSLKLRRHLSVLQALKLSNLSPEELGKFSSLQTQSQNALVAYQVATQNKDKASAAEQLQLHYQRSAELRQLEQNLKQKYPKFAQLSNPAAPSISQLQKQLPAGALLLDYILTKEQLYRLLISKDSAWVETCSYEGEKPSLNFAELSQLFSQPIKDEASQKALLKQLGQELWLQSGYLLPKTQTLEKLKINKLIIVPVEGLSLLPFELLLSSPAPAAADFKTLPYLIRKYPIQYSPSVGLWQQTLQSSQQQPKQGKILALAPSYQAPQQANRAVETKRPKLKLAELSGTVREVQMLEKYQQGDYLYGAAASESQLKERLKSPYLVVHFAMHGLLDDRNPNLSALALSPVDSSEDNLWTAAEIGQSQIKSQLVVLSACETAKGKLELAEGAMSLARYFLLADVPSVVATRWQVNDQTTAFIMQNFYKYLSEQQAIAEAMRQAQLDYLDQCKGSNCQPFYWAAFMNVGDMDKKLNLTAQSGNYWLYGLGLLPILGLLGWRFYKFRAQKG